MDWVIAGWKHQRPDVNRARNRPLNIISGTGTPAFADWRFSSLARGPGRIPPSAVSKRALVSAAIS
ncbi:hypothetical protein ETR_21372 [Erwinia tracheiphila PSU-1]|nr:hypothetical protein ETR_21372 [Erwinia tracheiphila PSU-1]